MDNTVRADIKIGAQNLLEDPRSSADFIGKMRDQWSKTMSKAFEDINIPSTFAANNLKHLTEDYVKSTDEIRGSGIYRAYMDDYAKLFTPDIDPEKFNVVKKRLYKNIDDIQKQIGQKFGGEWTEFQIGGRSSTAASIAEMQKASPGVATALEDWRLSLTGATQTYQDATDDLKVSIEKRQQELTGEKGEKEKGGAFAGTVPTYTALALLAVVSDLRQAAGIWQKYETTFDVGSPQGAMGTMMARDMAQRQAQYELTGKVIGTVVGAAIGSIFGGPAGGLAGGYLLGQVGGGIGDLIATPGQIERQVQLQIFKSMWDFGDRDIGLLAQQQSATYGAARKFGGRYQPNDFLAGFSVNTGLNSAQYAQYKDVMSGAYGGLSNDEMTRGIRTAARYNINAEDTGALEGIHRLTGNETPAMIKALDELSSTLKWGSVPELVTALKTYTQQASMTFMGANAARAAATMMSIPSAFFPGDKEYGMPGTIGGQQENQIMQAMFTPGNDAEDALMYYAIKKANPKATPFQILFAIRQGAFGAIPTGQVDKKGNKLYGPSNMNAMLDMLGSMPKDEKKLYLQSLALSKSGLNWDLAEEMIDNMANPETRATPTTKMKAKASKLLKSEQRPGQNVTDRELQGAISPADIQAAKIFESGAEAAKSIQASFYQMERDYVANQNEMVANEATLVMLTKRFQESLGEMWEKYYQANPNAPISQNASTEEQIGYYKIHGSHIIAPAQKPMAPLEYHLPMPIGHYNEENRTLIRELQEEIGVNPAQFQIPASVSTTTKQMGNKQITVRSTVAHQVEVIDNGGLNAIQGGRTRADY